MQARPRSQEPSGARVFCFARCVVVFGAVLNIVACASSQAGLGVGGRPLVYKQGPGDDAARPSSAPPPAATSSAESRTPPAVAANTLPAAAPSAAPPPAAAPPAPAAAPPPPSEQANTTLPPALARYTQATRYGDLLFLSGQIGVDPRTGEFPVEATVEQQTRQVLENIRLILEANRLTMANVVSVTVYLANINSLAAVDSIYPGFFKGTLPARSVIEAARLPRNAQLVISVVAGR